MDEMLNCELHERFSEFMIFFQIEIIGILVIFLSTFAFALTKISGIEGIISVDSVSLSLANLMILSSWFSYNLYSTTRVSKGFASVERMTSWSQSKELLEDDW